MFDTGYILQPENLEDLAAPVSEAEEKNNGKSGQEEASFNMAGRTENTQSAKQDQQTGQLTESQIDQQTGQLTESQIDQQTGLQTNRQLDQQTDQRDYGQAADSAEALDSTNPVKLEIPEIQETQTEAAEDTMEEGLLGSAWIIRIWTKKMELPH